MYAIGKENVLGNVQPKLKEKNDMGKSDTSDLYKKENDNLSSKWCDVQQNGNPENVTSMSLNEDNPPLFFPGIYAEIETSVHDNVQDPYATVGEPLPIAPLAVEHSTDEALGASSSLLCMPPPAPPAMTDEPSKIIKTKKATIDQPDCAERTLALISAFLRSEQCRSEGQDVGKEGDVVSFANVEDYIKLLEGQIAMEDLGTMIRTSPLLRRLRRDIPLLTDVSLPYDAKELSILEQLDTEVFRALRAIQPLDMKLLAECIERTMKADTSNKNIIMLLGCTGAGKSTITHYLAGSKMVEKPVLGKKNLSSIGESTIQQPLAFPLNPPSI